MKMIAKLGGLASIAAVVVVIAWSQAPRTSEKTETPRASSPSPPAVQKPIPKIIDLGAGKCIPCKAMAPILEQLRVDYAGRLDVQFIDVWENPEASEQYSIRTIPTQIFYAADGRELARHEGFIDREGILQGFKQLGVAISE